MTLFFDICFLFVCSRASFPGYNHSGKLGQINFLNGIMGYANAQRTLDYIRIITEFISQPEYQDVIPMFGIINEALVTTIGQDELTSL
jgi:glucan 1,3-beta-glucosidase